MTDGELPLPNPKVFIRVASFIGLATTAELVQTKRTSTVLGGDQPSGAGTRLSLISTFIVWATDAKMW